MARLPGDVEALESLSEVESGADASSCSPWKPESGLETRAQPYQAILFDLDGVLIDTDAAVAAVWHEQCRRYGRTLTEKDLLHRVYGCSPEETVARIFGPGWPHRGDLLRAVSDSEPFMDFEPTAGAADLVTTLRQTGLPLGLVTSGSSRRVGRVLASMGISAAFDAQVTWGEARGKPAPDPYLLAATRLEVEARRCLVFEDSVAGVTAAVSARATCIGVGAAQRERLTRCGAHAVTDTLEDVRVGRVSPPAPREPGEWTARPAVAEIEVTVAGLTVLVEARWDPA